ncbi:hypothetical protein ACHAWO_005328 [Cyclotella atomus]|uniref:Enhancer of polycomb-like protein n=1 Tax=Cyclotella atomus TaxID=382360 RepID=A0ABD3QX10_9STRA
MDESNLRGSPRGNLLLNSQSANSTPASSQRTSNRSSPANVPSILPPHLVSRPPLNQYLKIAVIRSPTDVVLCDDPERPGAKRQVAVGSLSNHTNVKTEQTAEKKEDNNNKRNIPVPTITTVRSYLRDVPPDFEVPQSYIRFSHPSYKEVDEAVEYNVDEEDENWWKGDEDFGPESKAKIIWEGDAIQGDDSAELLQSLSPMDVIARNPRYYMSTHGTYWLVEKHRPRLPLVVFEKMLDVLEKATGFETIVTVAQAEAILTKKIPVLNEIFSNTPPVIKERRHADTKIAIQSSSDDATMNKSPNRIPAFGPPITLSAAIFKVYTHWMQKRSRLRKPLLRRFWPATASADINPHMVFRPREKEKRKLRKKRQNDIESYKKMKMLKLDFECVKTLCDLIVRREGVTSLMVDLTNEYYQQRLHDWLDTTGEPRQAGALTKDIIEKVLDVPKLFEDGPINLKTSKNKKRKRSSASGSSILEMERPCMPTAPESSLVAARAVQPKKDVIVAGHDGGFPAPSFLDPLPSRESAVVDWADEAPFVPYCENGKEIKVVDYKHRARMGRGGRIMIDRIPCLYEARPLPKTVTFGSSIVSFGYHPSTLGADGQTFSSNSPSKDGIKNSNKDAPTAPPPKGVSDLQPPSLGNHLALSRRIEAICAKSIRDDLSEQQQQQKIVLPGNDTDEILIPLEDFLDAPPGFYGKEKYVIGPF